jgi:hypothetical protein
LNPSTLGTLAALSLLLIEVDRAHDIAGGLFFSATPAIDDSVVDNEGDLQLHPAKTGNDNTGVSGEVVYDLK